MLAKHKVGSSTLLTRSMKKPLEMRGLFYFYGRGTIALALRGFGLTSVSPFCSYLIDLRRLNSERKVARY
jgi:hypothetical protein